MRNQRSTLEGTHFHAVAVGDIRVVMENEPLRNTETHIKVNILIHLKTPLWDHSGLLMTEALRDFQV